MTARSILKFILAAIACLSSGLPLLGQSLNSSEGSFLGKTSYLGALATPEQVQATEEIEEVSLAIKRRMSLQSSRFRERGLPPKGLFPGGLCSEAIVDVSDLPPISPQDLAEWLTADLIDQVPVLDPWGFAYEYLLDQSSFRMAIVSSGADGEFSGPSYSIGEIANESEDLVLVSFVWAQRSPVHPNNWQRETVIEMHNIAAAISSWVIDQLPLNSQASGNRAVDLDLFSPITPSDLADLLGSIHIFCLPEFDFWGHPYEFWLDTITPGTTESVAACRSAGEDGLVSGNRYVPGAFPAAEAYQDIVWKYNQFVRYPDHNLLFIDGFESGNTSQWE